MADGGRGREVHPDLGHLGDVVKQLASIQVDGDNLSRRLQDLRAVAAASTAATWSSSVCHGVAHTTPRSSMEEIDNSSTSNCSKAAVVRSPKRQHGSLVRDPIFNGDVVKLCSLTKLLTDENDRLQALNANLQVEIRETREDCCRQLEAAKKNAADSEARLRSAMQQLDEAARHMEILVRERERLKQENLVDHQQEQEQEQEEEPGTEEALPPGFGESKKSMHSVIAVLEKEASALLQIDGAEAEQGHVKSELQRLAMEFIQGVFKIEDEVTANKAAPLRSKEEQQKEDQDTAEWCRMSSALNYLLPTAAASGAFIAIAISLKASSTAAAAAALAVTEQQTP